jgi:hypothetical protein
MELTFKVSARIAKPVAEVFEAIANPSELSRYPSYNGAKLPFELAVTIPRDRLRTRYGDGFLGAPLMLCRPSRTRWPDHGGADAKAQDNTPDAQGPGEP